MQILPVWVRATIYYSGRKPDISGCYESIGDCLEGFAWKDDTLISHWDGSRLYRDKANPRTIVEVYRYNAEIQQLSWLEHGS